MAWAQKRLLIVANTVRGDREPRCYGAGYFALSTQNCEEPINHEKISKRGDECVVECEYEVEK